MTKDTHFPPVNNGASYSALPIEVRRYGIRYLPNKDLFFLLTGNNSYQKIILCGGARKPMTLKVKTVEKATTNTQLEELSKAVALRDLVFANKLADIAKNENV
jgi:hypothetical protein